MNVWVLHEAIPHKLNIAPVAASKTIKEKTVLLESVSVQVEEAIMDIDCPTEVQNVKKLFPHLEQPGAVINIESSPGYGPINLLLGPLLPGTFSSLQQFIFHVLLSSNLKR